MNRVFLLGAGFSYAIDKTNMPLMKDLAGGIPDALARLGFPQPPVDVDQFEGDVERWLSHLSQPPPWLEESDSLRSRAAAVDVTRAITQIIKENEAKVYTASSQVPSFLNKLVNHWSDQSAAGSANFKTTVITFNYDTLIEHAYAASAARRNGVDLLIAPLTPYYARGGTTIVDRGDGPFQLLKLHGSIDWFYSGTPEVDASDIVYHHHEPLPWPTAEVDAADFLTADKVSFIVPPVMVKTALYGNAALRVQWRGAAAALASQSVEELVIMGFSMPQTDTLVRDLIKLNLKSSPKIVVVTRRQETVDVTRKILGLPEERMGDAFLGDDAVKDWVDANI